MKLELRVDGRPVSVRVAPLTPLSAALRAEGFAANLPEGCEEGRCGSCLVLLDGRPVAPCITPCLHARGAEVVTAGGLARSSESAAVLAQLLDEEEASPCGFCLPGLLVAGHHALAAWGARAPDDEEIDAALAGQVCRCTDYSAARRALRRASATGAGEAEE